MSKPFRLPLRKRIFTHPKFQDFASWLVALLIRICWPTYRRTIQISDISSEYMHGNKQAIFCFWHGRMLIFPSIKPPKRPMHVLISQHRDGELIAKVIRHFGIDTVRGSSSRGASNATRALIQMLRDGHNISITPDGPRGPFQKAQKGAVMLAQLSKQPLVPVSFSASSNWRLRSWDRMMIPLPFARLVIRVGEPILVDKDAASLDDWCAVLEQTLNELTDRADAAVSA
jgi:lysophospholipid acyltransferase (LPLAT)-like uncharacterized protein